MNDPGIASRMRQAINGFTAEASVSLNAVSSSGTVQRTRRVVRQRALSLEQRRRRVWSIFAACLLCSILMAILTVPLWNELDDFAHANGIPDLQIHMVFLAVWFLPGTVVSLLLWRGYRRQINAERM